MKSFCYLSYRPKYSGYGYGVQQFANAFKRRGFSFTFRHDAHLKKHPVKEDVVIHSGFPHFFRLDGRRINIARVMLESDSLPRLWVDVLNSMDEVWAASRFNAGTFKNAGVDPSKIHVVPDIADPRFAHAAKLRKGRKGRASGKSFRFLSVFLDLSLRKGYDLMFSEFIKNFSGRKDVEWAVQCSANAAKGFRILLADVKKTGVDVGNIIIIGKRPSARELERLYLRADCYVLPTRGEGFGRPYLEAASTGLPVIATGFGGQRDFLNSKNSRLLDYRLVNVPAPDALDCYFLAGQRWAQPSRADLSRALNEALERPKREPVDVSEFTEERVMDIISKRLDKVRKVSKVPKIFAPQIITYDKNWKEAQPSP
ncbi:MAG: glycosyltransferase, partial [Nitrospinota bacterium]